MGKENARQAGQWAANGNNKKQIKMPGNNFCQRVSLTLHCGQPATKMRIICASTTWGLPKDCCRLQGEGARGAWIVLQVVSASGECSLVLCWTQNCKSCNLCALRLRTASAISTNCLIYDQSGFSIVYVCVCTCVCAVCTNFSNHTKPDSAEILIIVCEAASQSITQISCSTSKDDDGGICNVSRQAQVIIRSPKGGGSYSLLG